MTTLMGKAALMRAAMGRRLRQLAQRLHSHRISQGDIADKMGVKQSVVNRWLRGNANMTTESMLMLIVTLRHMGWEVTPNWLLFGVGAPPWEGRA